jgi:hypothetical protein
VLIFDGKPGNFAIMAPYVYPKAIDEAAKLGIASTVSDYELSFGVKRDLEDTTNEKIEHILRTLDLRDREYPAEANIINNSVLRDTNNEHLAFPAKKFDEYTMAVKDLGIQAVDALLDGNGNLEELLIEIYSGYGGCITQTCRALFLVVQSYDNSHLLIERLEQTLDSINSK